MLYEILKVHDVYLMHDCVSIQKHHGSNVGKNVEELLLGSDVQTSWLGSLVIKRQRKKLRERRNGITVPCQSFILKKLADH